MLGILIKVLSNGRAFYFFNFVFWFAQWVFWVIVDKIYTYGSITISAHSLQYFSAFVISCIIRYYYKRSQITKRKLFRIILAIIITTLLGGIIWLIIWSYIELRLWNIPFYEDIYNLFKKIWFLSFLIFTWNLLYFGISIYIEFLTQKENVSKAILLARQAQLEMLRYQLNPHFLFNTFSSLRALIRNRNTDIAESMVTKMSEFLKYSLLEGEENEVFLSK